MLGGVRLRFTIIFIVITSLVYLVTSACGILAFWLRMNAVLDEEISSLQAETIAHITCTDGKPVLHMNSAVFHRAFHQAVSLQVYDKDGNLLQFIGAKGVPQLAKNSNEVTSADGQRYRNSAMPLPCERLKIDGAYLQVQVTTRQRDTAIANYIEIAILLAPLLLIGLAIAGSQFAGWAVRPIQQSINALRRFLADAGHELGTPLAILRTTADNLTLDVEGMPQAEERVEIMSRTTIRMAKLVDDMALLARLETAELTLAKKTLKLDELVGESINSFRELFAEKSLTVKTDLAKDLQIEADKSTIERMLTNLLQNAIRYTDNGGSITVSLNARDNNAILTIADTGIGIPADAIPHLFDRFYRVDKARERAAGGSGLGLAIVKASVDAHGGKVEIQSKEGQGSQFIISIPLASKSKSSN